MGLPKTLAAIKRYGPRYGSRLKHKVAEIENLYKKPRKCPYCKYKAVKRLSVGIWNCKKCNSKFAGKAYTFGKYAAISKAKAKLAEVAVEEGYEDMYSKMKKKTKKPAKKIEAEPKEAIEG